VSSVGESQSKIDLGGNGVVGYISSRRNPLSGKESCMIRTLMELAQLVGGTVLYPSGQDSSEARVNSDSHRAIDTIQIRGSSTIRNAQDGDITFATNETIWKACQASAASAAVISGFQPGGDVVLPCILVPDAERAFAEITKQFRPQPPRHAMGISPKAVVSPLAKIGNGVSVYPNAYVGDHVTIGDNTTIMPGVCIMENCQIGNEVTIFPNAVLYENTIVGDRVILHAGVVLGAFGFGYRTEGGRHKLSSQLGNVIVEDDVEIGANSTIDRGTFDATRIGAGTKIDDQVMIGHNCEIGKNNLLCSQVGIAGSSTTGDNVTMAGQVGIGDHIDIGNQVIIGAKAGVMNDIKHEQHYLGIPATPIREQMLIMASIQKLPELRKQLSRLVKQVNEMAATEEAQAIEPPAVHIDSRRSDAA
jgi:UDP-3-O-[3-hydroxymyristoyl] glucosamine N-acyltransferase